MGDDNATEGYLTSDYAPIQPSSLYWRKLSVCKKAVGNSIELIRAVENERSVFIGCLPEGAENMEEILQDLMETFLGRFDFAPSVLSQVRGVKIVKDFAFVEFALDGVAQIVLAANQIDAFDWVVRGVLFNIEGCNGTHTSVRPLIEFMPLKPARVILICNIPKVHWEEQYLKTFFCKILQGSEESLDMNLVVAVYLLPESSDAYLELPSEFIADAIVYKCTKSSDILKSIGDDAFICRHLNLVPLMSKHTCSVCPQRTLFVGLSYGGEKFKIECIRKIFEEVLSMISRKSNYHGYIECISVQPGTDYTFFQFDSEATTDAIMDEYIENTPLFSGGIGSPVSYIILRPPQYVRPGANYRSSVRFALSSRGSYQHEIEEVQSNQAYWMHTEGSRHASMTGNQQELTGNKVGPLTRAGNDSRKKADVVMSVGSTILQPCEDWQGRSSGIDCSFDSGSAIIVEGLVRGIGYKLLRGALNELFERALSNSGLLQVGMHVVRYLDRDPETGKVVACLPNAEFADTLLSSRNSFELSGRELCLLSNGPRKSSHRKWNASSLTDDEGEMSYFSGEGNKGRAFVRGLSAKGRTVPHFSPQRKRSCAEFDSQCNVDYDEPERYLNRASKKKIFRRSVSVERTATISQQRKRLHKHVDSQYHPSDEMPERDTSIASRQTDLSMPELQRGRCLRSSSSESLEKELIRGRFKEGLKRRIGAREQNFDLSGPRKNKISLLIAERIKRGRITRERAFESKEGSKFLNRVNSYIPTQNGNIGANVKRFSLQDNAKRYAALGRKARAINPRYSSERWKHSRKRNVENLHISQQPQSQAVRDRLVKNLQPGQNGCRKRFRFEDNNMLMSSCPHRMWEENRR